MGARLLFLAVFIALYVGYALGALLLFRDYWAVWTLEPAASPPQSP